MRWRYLAASGGEIGGSEELGDREAAEAWLGSAWLELRDSGVDAVELLDEAGETIYRMSLEDT